MTAFGIYLAVYYLLNIVTGLYYLGKGGYTVTPGVLVFSVIWLTGNLLGIVFLGTGLGI